jgi:hypothetical protein
MVAALIQLVIWIIVVGLIFWVLNYLVDTIPLPEPFHRIAKVVLAVVAVLIVLVLLLQLLGISTGFPPLRAPG